MRRLSFVLLAFVVVLFVQCEKEPIVQDDSKMVPVRFELPIDNGKTDFTDLLSNSDTQSTTIKWNCEGTETVYLAVPNVRMINPVTGELLYEQNTAQMVPLTAECNGSSKLVFTGSVDSRILEDGKFYTLYYLGNNGEAQEGSNVTDIRNNNGVLVGKRIYFDGQDGSREKLGNYHVAVLDVAVYANLDENNIPESYTISSSYPMFSSLTSIALLDLENETKLLGDAVTTSMTVSYNKYTNRYEAIYSSDVEMSLGAVTSNSFITLCPSAEGSTLKCGKGEYVFEDGVESNSVYYSYNVSTHEISPLKWK